MPTVTTNDGTEIYKDWGTGRPIVFHHGWPLSSDDWDAQLMFFVLRGYRVIAHDRRGHGRSTQTSDGHDMDTYAADAAAVVERLDLRAVIPVHYEGWTHLHQDRRAAEQEFARAPQNVRRRIHWLPAGIPTELASRRQDSRPFGAR